jgi:hypothetical protein
MPNTSELGTTIEDISAAATLSQQHDSQETIHAKTVASNYGEVADASDTYVLEIQPYVVSPQQLPSTIVQVSDKTGKTRTSAMLTCRMQNGLLCTVPMRHLATIIGDTALHQLMPAFESPQSYTISFLLLCFYFSVAMVHLSRASSVDCATHGLYFYNHWDGRERTIQLA